MIIHPDKMRSTSGASKVEAAGDRSRFAGSDDESVIRGSLARRHTWRRRIGRRSDALFPYELILLPALAMLVFQMVPVVHGILISLQDFSIWNPEPVFVGLWNYSRVLSNPLFYLALKNTGLFLVLAVGLELVSGLCIALLINKPFPGERVVRILLLFPLLVAPVVAGLMFYWMFNAEFGFINKILGLSGLPTVLWFNRPWTAFLIIVLADVWTWTPWFTLLLYSALQTLPPEPVEAARLDGANAWQIFHHITLPLLFPVASFTVLIRSFDAFRVFDVVWTMTGGGPGNATEVFGTFVYRIGLLTVNYSEGAAAAMIGAVIIMVVGLVVYRTFSRIVWGRTAS
ncbi:MAG TPA: sugar ABC transporter permease [Candidatus Methylomirabilis sp.]|nr:sugar ABC transporter permease [Candidatus Methylomirabilis sp.]